MPSPRRAGPAPSTIATIRMICSSRAVARFRLQTRRSWAGSGCGLVHRRSFRVRRRSTADVVRARRGRRRRCRSAVLVQQHLAPVAAILIGSTTTRSTTRSPAAGSAPAARFRPARRDGRPGSSHRPMAEICSTHPTASRAAPPPARSSRRRCQSRSRAVMSFVRPWASASVVSRRSRQPRRRPPSRRTRSVARRRAGRARR